VSVSEGLEHDGGPLSKGFFVLTGPILSNQRRFHHATTNFVVSAVMIAGTAQVHAQGLGDMIRSTDKAAISRPGANSRDAAFEETELRPGPIWLKGLQRDFG
jgi:hypothetical protein